MVLQRNGARILGFGAPGSTVAATMDGEPIGTVTVDDDSSWQLNVSMPATPPAHPGFNLTFSVRGDSSSTVSLTQILFGEVWLCGGQSNMGLPLDYVENGTAEINAMVNHSEQNGWTNIRLMQAVPHECNVQSNTTNSSCSSAATPQADWPGDDLALMMGWSLPNERWRSPQTNRLSQLSAASLFSAVCWTAGRRMHAHFEGQVPFGLIRVNWGGTPIEAWSSKEALAECGLRRPDRWPAPTMGAHFNTRPEVLFNTWIAPLLRMQVAGEIFFQGENNAHYPRKPNAPPAPVVDGTYYRCAMPAMIRDYRKKFQQRLPFILAQLCSYCNSLHVCDDANPKNITDQGEELPRVREAQRRAAHDVPDTAMAVTADYGDAALPHSPAGQVHSRIKEPVGMRLARAALKVLRPTGLRSRTVGPSPSAGAT
eukprot:COSAG01_NODE_175_length_22996_cov_18.857892_19_plen_426_part_00